MMNLKKWLSEFIKRLLVGGLNIKEALQLQKLNLMAKIKALINGAVIDGVKPDLTALFKRAKQYLQTTAHTWANTVSNGVLSAWGKNRVSGWRHISVLDSRTSLVCTARHGKLWDKKHQPIGHDWVFHVPPLHPNCRSMLVPASLDEPFEGITGDDWVNSRSLKELQEQFGVGIGQMLHDGTISLHDAVRQGGLVPMTLDELHKKKRFEIITTVDFSGIKVVQAEIDRLAFDVDKKSFVLEEAIPAAEWQQYFNVRLERNDLDTDKRPDFLIIQAGVARDKLKTLDFMFTLSGLPKYRIDGFNNNFSNNQRNWRKQQNSIQNHLEKADIVPMDLRYLNDKNLDKLTSYVLSLPKEQRRKIVFIVGKV